MVADAAIEHGRRAPGAPVPRARAPRVLTATFVVLALYATFGKGFAYAGVPPLFVGEAMLAVIAAAVVGPRMKVPRHPAAAVAAALGAIAAVQAIGDLSRGVDALETARGLAPIYYAGYGFGVYALLRRLERRDGRDATSALVDRALARATPAVIGGLALLALLLAAQPDGLLTWPGSGVRMLFSKAGDIAVGLALTGAVLARRRDGGPPLPWPRALMALWAVAAVLAVFRSRGALLGLAAGGFAMRPRPERVVKGLTAAIAVVVLLYVSGISIRVESDREVDARSAVESLVSLAGGTDEDAAGSNYVATREWRSAWWAAIWRDVEDHAMVGHGTGWGDNLAVRYGVVEPSRAVDPLVLRLPHNVFFSLAGRAGLVVAAGFVAVPLITLARSYRRPDAPPTPTPLATEVARAGIATGLVTAMADIYFESPQGGILLWSLLGLLWWVQARPLDARCDAAAVIEGR